jgi:hypothetical protein
VTFCGKRVAEIRHQKMTVFEAGMAQTEARSGFPEVNKK